MFGNFFHRKKTANPPAEPEEKILPGTDLRFLFCRDRFRTLRLSIKPDGTVKVKAPSSLPMEEVFRFVKSREAWIQEKRDFFAAHRKKEHTLCPGGTAWYMGRPFTIEPVPAGRNARPMLKGNRLLLPCRDDSQEELLRVFRLWQKNLALRVLDRRMARLQNKACQILGDRLLPSSLTVRSLKRRWGSCSAGGNIMLACQLIALPLPLLDYVLLHELCHLRRMDHGPAFRAYLLRILPDAATREAHIRSWSLEHPRF